MNNERVAQELVKIAKELVGADTFPCPDCGTKVLDQTEYCVKCQKKVKKGSESREAISSFRAPNLSKEARNLKERVSSLSKQFGVRVDDLVDRLSSFDSGKEEDKNDVVDLIIQLEDTLGSFVDMAKIEKSRLDKWQDRVYE